MEQKIIELKMQLNHELLYASTNEELENLRVKFLGKKGLITELLQALKDAPAERRRDLGLLINNLKQEAEALVLNKTEQIKLVMLENEIKNVEPLDLTLPSKQENGSLHPITTVQKELEEIFKSMGFVVEDGNEIETEYNNFVAVNIPATHPARDMQDTFWLENGQVLKTHTSASQNRILKKYGAPCSVIFPGRCFRNENLDASHENTFFQLEGVMVDTHISIANLIYFMKQMLSKVFKKDLQVRLRPGYFPFVEPGFELDVSCPFCNGKGCSTCKKGGWIELCPCGMIHPEVLKMGGIDTDKYQGFAFGLGLTRLAMIKYNINEIRNLNSGNLKFLKQIGTR